jgi:8-amino-3,8-dideoxy-alpha-D-manno-octulosonate transaminase
VIAAVPELTALTAENVPTWHLYRPDHPDFHVYAHWNVILNKTSSTAAGYPWAPAFYSGTASYSADMCPRTLDLLGRALNIDVNPLYSDEDVDQVIAAIQKVADALL